MTSRKRKRFAGRSVIVAAALLFLLNPLFHLHYRAPVPDAGSISAPSTSPSSCVACKFQTNVVVAVAELALEPPATTDAIVSTLEQTSGSAELLGASSRAPPPAFQ